MKAKLVNESLNEYVNQGKSLDINEIAKNLEKRLRINLKVDVEDADLIDSNGNEIGGSIFTVLDPKFRGTDEFQISIDNNGEFNFYVDGFPVSGEVDETDTPTPESINILTRNYYQEILAEANDYYVNHVRSYRR